ncbi:MAG TPA: NADH-quinone oxidoreductase subunit NuoF [Kiritimatiellia bacterium]|nr:NADH-quinone oxidoreductase subunit NuoF [Kiritimatiellia bacterium]HRZ11372.1 NADH-quinone oxidoreductase subunit NuoF [Kiritimatiellia bacterium]HSA17077.1 NADH-quinone oxidoreductase subunit NuoF [Kiritimatiellia bacterium]
MAALSSHRILICVGTSGVAAGAEKVAAAFQSELERRGLLEKFDIVRTGDRGLFRDVLVDVITPELGRVVYEFIQPEHVAEIVEEHLVHGRPVEKRRAGQDYEAFFKNQTRIVLANCGEIDPEHIEDYRRVGGYQALRKAMDMTPQAVIEEVHKAGLRGRGGAGFSTGQKWRFCREAKGDLKYVICNADEGDPGAFMDRSLLEGDPHAVIEGMIIAGYAIGAREGVIYCRAEYPLAVRRLTLAIEQARREGCLGSNILGCGFDFDVSIMQGAGAFVCGEETALIASIEGRRGTPRVKPPFPAHQGLWGQPTLINNVETFGNIPPILRRGWEWFAAIGTERSRGTKVFALAGQVRNAGLVEVPMGMTLRELIFGAGGGMSKRRIGLKGVQLGGPSGGCVPESLLDTPIDYESITGTGAIMGSGGLIIMDERTCMVDVARYFLSFTVAESCGQCTPCRVGLKRMHEALEEITAGHGTPEHIAFLQEMGETIKSTALCGLGQTAANPVLTTLRYFRHEYDAHVHDKECPAHACKALRHFEVIESACTKCGRCFKACPANAIEWKKGQAARIDLERCTRCQTCYGACDFMAIR